MKRWISIDAPLIAGSFGRVMLARLCEEMKLFWSALQVCCGRVGLFLVGQDLRKLVFLAVIVVMATSPAMFDLAITAQYLGYDTVMLIVDVQFAMVLLFVSTRLMRPALDLFRRVGTRGDREK